MGGLIFLFFPGLRRSISLNLKQVLGPSAHESQIKALTRQVCVNIAKGHYELFRLSRMTADDVKARAKFVNREHLDRALAEGRGAVLFSAHLGNTEWAMQLPLAHGMPLSGTVYHTKPERLFRYTTGLRTRFGLKLIPSDHAVIGLFRALKRGEMICLPVDRNLSDSARELPFFGRPALLPTGPVQVALRTGAPLVPVFVERLPDDRLHVHVEPQIEIPQTGDVEADVLAAMTKAVALMERYIARHPEQWLVAAPIWPTENLDNPDQGENDHGFH
jgi:KDO2-lipid IV(A) lauroyltransferase